MQVRPKFIFIFLYKQTARALLSTQAESWVEPTVLFKHARPTLFILSMSHEPAKVLQLFTEYTTTRYIFFLVCEKIS